MSKQPFIAACTVALLFASTTSARAQVSLAPFYDAVTQLGANVTRVRLAGAQTHFSTPGASAPLYVPWIEDRFAGKPVPDGCSVT